MVICLGVDLLLLSCISVFLLLALAEMHWRGRSIRWEPYRRARVLTLGPIRVTPVSLLHPFSSNFLSCVQAVFFSFPSDLTPGDPVSAFDFPFDLECACAFSMTLQLVAVICPWEGFGRIFPLDIVPSVKV